VIGSISTLNANRGLAIFIAILTSAFLIITAAAEEPVFSISGKYLASVNEASNRSAQAYNKATLAALYAMPKELAVQYFKTDKTKAQKFKSFLERQMEKGLTVGFEVRRREQQGLMFSVDLVVGEKQILKLIEKFTSEPAKM
jgi:hypothetical protein